MMMIEAKRVPRISLWKFRKFVGNKNQGKSNILATQCGLCAILVLEYNTRWHVQMGICWWFSLL